jgi:hypothetical protein
MLEQADEGNFKITLVDQILRNVSSQFEFRQYVWYCKLHDLELVIDGLLILTLQLRLFITNYFSFFSIFWSLGANRFLTAEIIFQYQ